jgi:prephenate dehydrogenase
MDLNVIEPEARLESTIVAIVGLGLMGGSLAMALKGAVRRVVGVDLDAASLELALKSQIVDEATSRLEEGMEESDLVVLAVPARSIADMVRAMPELRPDGCMVMDLGSTKAEINMAMDGLPPQFAAVGGHPMCGREKSGLLSATKDLFGGETFVLCRNQRTTSRIEEIALELIEKIGASPLFLPADKHDRLVAASSHLPYVVSSILMVRAWVEAQKDARLWQVSASGLYDTTRLSGSSPEMMLEIMMTNGDAIIDQIKAYQEELSTLSDALQRQDWETLQIYLRSVHLRRLEYLREKKHSEDRYG